MGKAEQAVGAGAREQQRNDVGDVGGPVVGRLTALGCLQVPPGSPKPSHPLIISELPAPGVTKARLMPINEGEVGKG